MIIYDHKWSYVTRYSQILLDVIVYHGMGSYIVICDHIWPNLIKYDSIWSCLRRYDQIWSYMIIINHILSYMITCDNIWQNWPNLIISNITWSYMKSIFSIWSDSHGVMITFGNMWSCIIWFSRVVVKDYRFLCIPGALFMSHSGPNGSWRVQGRSGSPPGRSMRELEGSWASMWNVCNLWNYQNRWEICVKAGKA